MAKNYLTPSYLETDFNSLKTRLNDLMQQSEVFKDYNYEGSNIAMLIELISYLTDLTTFYTNKVAKNVYPETAEIFETSNSLARLRGYFPKASVSGQVDLTVTVNTASSAAGSPEPGDTLYIPAWYAIDTGLTTDDEEEIYYSTVESYTTSIPMTATEEYSFDIEVKQGQYYTVEYTGEDIIDYEIILPSFNFDFDTTDHYTNNSSFAVYVDEVKWERVENFYDEVTTLSDTDKVYMIEYDKYKRYNLRFSPSREVPDKKAQIRIVALQSLGEDGAIGANILNSVEQTQRTPVLIEGDWETEENYFLYNITQSTPVSQSYFSINNAIASRQAKDPDTIDEMKTGGEMTIYSQLRNITAEDYIGHLEQHDDIVKANAWGESEENPGNTNQYNKVYLSIIPEEWGTHTIDLSAGYIWQDSETPSLTAGINVPHVYNINFKDDLKVYLEPRRYLNTYESFVVPELVYFRFEIGVVVKRVYSFKNIEVDLKNKLDYYFRKDNRTFGEEIDFREVYNYLLDVNEISEDDDFDSIRGIKNLVIRDIETFTPSITGAYEKTHIFDYNTDGNYPMYVSDGFPTTTDNILRGIKLGFNQFPILSKKLTKITNEG